MRNAAVVLASFLLTSAVHAASVEMRRPHIEFMSSVEAPCHVHRKGCTTITADFYCGCGESGGKWVAVPQVVAKPTIYATTDEVLKHEFLHLADIRVSLRAYTSSLTLRTFETESACSAFVDEETRAFSHVMALIQRETTIRRDGVRYADTNAPDPVVRRGSSPAGARR